ncbi:MAG: cation diffusion facilitator family transporter [Pseudomonadota bacterium]
MTVSVKNSYRKKQCTECSDDAVRLDFFVAIAKALFGGGMGMLTGSVGLHAVAFLASGDILSKGINWLSVYISRKPATERFPYGYGKVQFLSALLIGILLMGGATLFFSHNVENIQAGQISPPGGLAMISALLLAITGEIMYRMLSHTAQCNNNAAIRAAAADNRVDAISSFMVLVGTFLTYIGWIIADHLMALAVLLFVAKIGWDIASDAVRGLLDFGLPTEMEQQIRAVGSSISRIMAIQRVRGRRLGDAFAIELEIHLAGDLSLFAASDIMAELKKSIHEQVPHIDTIHITFMPEAAPDTNGSPA